ncbi:MAG: anhydro-N-acetylmuramic acid kinase [Eudoraea sp.]|nr:anhydro-N-acetylmuramic acid kinase [Eudoraea sp.]
MKIYKVIALMSGTSLDGLDIAYCHFYEEESGWRFDIKQTHHVPYQEKRIEALRNAISLSTLDHIQLHHEYGNWLGRQVKVFINTHNLEADLIASHGHTTHHRPDLGLTMQLGCGQHLANTSGIQTVCDFRAKDVALGGQGAPLVPIGDQLLFGQYTFCLNLGGISNISFQQQGKRIAYDIGIANMLLNHIANKAGMLYDEGGAHAAAGTINKSLLEALNQLPYYKKPFPKSTGYEWFLRALVPLVEKSRDSINNLLCTSVHHITDQVAAQVRTHLNPDNNTLLVTGGGANNDYLIQLLTKKLEGQATVIVPDKILVDYKEALVFGLMGVLRMEKRTNVLASVTGACCDSVSGVIYLPS